MKKIVSVIVPIYNTDKYLERCINSILLQSFKSIQIILVNDGSSDNSLTICKRYIREYDNIILIDKKENEGAASARNAGIFASTGEYIAFVDSDDYIDEHYIEYLLNNLISYKADVACCGNIKVEGTLLLNTDQLRYHYLKSNKYFNESPVHKLYRKSIFDDILYNNNHYYEDTYITYRLIEKTNTATYHYDDSYHITRREDSLTGSKIDDRYYDCILANKELYEYYFDSKYRSLAFKKYAGTILYFLLKFDLKKDDNVLNAKKNLYDLIRENGLLSLKYKQFLIYLYIKIKGIL